MLEQVTISGAPCFGDRPLVLHPLQRVNFVFGPNGSGKTSISRALYGDDATGTSFVWHDSTPLTIKVYNRDFVNRTLLESNRIPGVFVVGNRSVEAEERLAEIEGDKGERAQAEGNLGRAESSLRQAEATDSDATAEFLESVWAAYKNFIGASPSLKPAFSGAGGIGNSKQALAERLLKHPPSDRPTPELETLTGEADAVFADASATAQLQQLPPFEAESHVGYGLLGQRVVGSDSVTLSELVKQLGNSDWVAGGRRFLRESEGVCPFCQQIAPKNLASDLATMFDDQYAAQCTQIEEFKAAYDAWRAKVTAAAEAAASADSRFLDSEALQNARRTLGEVIAENSLALTLKAGTPSEPVRFTTVQTALKSVNDVIDAANEGIKAHNLLVHNRKTARPQLVTDCWRYLAEAVLGATLSTHKGKQVGRIRAIKALQERVTQAKEVISKLDEEVRTLHRSVESTRPAIDQINGILERSGFTSFKIVESESLPNGYMLSRGDGEVQERSLSEGERTFIAFLYYFHLLDGRVEGADESPRVLAVVDDPISSLDSDVLFVVGSLVRNLIARATSKRDRIEQVLVLTHNVYFHKEITHVRQGESSGGRTYFLIRKRPSTPSTVESGRANPIQTEYGRLWAEVRRAIDGEAMNVIGLENILRRILESYFRVMGGGIWDDEITPLLNADERHVFQALFRWVNDGSHSVIEDAHYSPSSISQDLYLQVFERIFVVTKHEAHYRMMLYGKRSLDELEESAVA